MGLILSIETTSTNCSVALGKNGALLALRENNSDSYSHAEQLHPFMNQVLTDAGKTMSQLDALAVSMGPGSYTGLRIGISAAKGLCYALDIPLIAIDTLTILQARVPADEFTSIIPLLDARRMEVYTAVYSKTRKLTPTEALIVNETSFETYLDQGKTLFIGSGATKFKTLCKHPHATFKEAFPSAREMVHYAEEKFTKEDFEDIAYFKPFYLKDFFIKKNQ